MTEPYYHAFIQDGMSQAFCDCGWSSDATDDWPRVEEALEQHKSETGHGGPR